MRISLCHNVNGFTAVELIVAIAVLGLLVGATVTVLMTGSQAYLTGTNQAQAQSSARSALEVMAQEIRGAGVDPQNIGFNAINNPTAASFTIQSDLNGNGVIDAGTNEQVTYALVGTDLQRQGQPIISGVQALTFTYLDATGAVTVTSANIRTIQISITTQPQNQPSSWQTGKVAVTMTDQIRVRNRN